MEAISDGQNGLVVADARQHAFNLIAL